MTQSTQHPYGQDVIVCMCVFGGGGGGGGELFLMQSCDDVYKGDVGPYRLWCVCC